jgi:hypothetical protein
MQYLGVVIVGESNCSKSDRRQECE